MTFCLNFDIIYHQIGRITILFYNWSKISVAAKNEPIEIFRIFKMIVKGEIPNSIGDPIYKYSAIDFSGASFLKNPEMLLYNAYKYSYKDITRYLAIASVRPYAEYLVRGTLTLLLSEAPVDPREYFDSPELITVKNGVLHFLYETPPLSIQH